MVAVVAGTARSWDRAPVWRDNGVLFRQTVLDVPSSSRAHWMLAEYLSLQESPRAGVDEMLLAVTLGRKDDPTLLGYAGDVMTMAGMCHQATVYYLRALKLMPEDVQLRANTSLCLLRLGRIDEARVVAQAGPSKTAGDPRLTRVVSISDSLAGVRDAKARARQSLQAN
jgi:predicted Zn-dependent protease